MQICSGTSHVRKIEICNQFAGNCNFTISDQLRAAIIHLYTLVFVQTMRKFEHVCARPDSKVRKIRGDLAIHFLNFTSQTSYLIVPTA